MGACITTPGGDMTYTEYGVELLAGEIAGASSLEQCQKYGPRKWIVQRAISVSVLPDRVDYAIGAWERM